MASISGVNTSNIDNINGFYTTQSGGGTATTDPTITLTNSTVYFDQSLTITNHSTSYTNPTYFIEVYVGAVKIISNDEIRVENNKAYWTDNDSTSGTRTVKIRAQEFGDFVDSNEVTDTYTRTAPNFRYYRWYASSTGPETFTATTSRLAINDIRLFTGAGRTGTEYPTTALTSATSETGIIVSSGFTYNATYDNWKAFDSSTSTMFWTIGISNSSLNWLELEYDSGTYATPPDLNSYQIRIDTNNTSSYIFLYGSNTGSFTGEETLINVQASLQTADTTYNIG